MPGPVKIGPCLLSACATLVQFIVVVVVAVFFPLSAQCNSCAMANKVNNNEI